MPEFVPMLEVVGMPLSVPVEVLKLAHAGLLAIVKEGCLQREMVTVGVNAYAFPAATVVGGEPEIVSDAASALKDAASPIATSRHGTA
jgi:hypothetical protein